MDQPAVAFERLSTKAAQDEQRYILGHVGNVDDFIERGRLAMLEPERYAMYRRLRDLNIVLGPDSICRDELTGRRL